MKTSKIFILSCMLLLIVSCTEINPAGPSSIVNPVYPDAEKGFFYCGSSPEDCVFSSGSTVLWISDPANHRLIYKDVSRAIVNPTLVDTLPLKFPPGILAAHPSSDFVYASEDGGSAIHRLNTTTLEVTKVYEAGSSISRMEISVDGSRMFIASRSIPWRVEAVSTDSWEVQATLPVDWQVQKLALSPDNRVAAIGSSGRTDIVVLDWETLQPLDTLHMPMRTGTMCFLQNSPELAVFDAASLRPFMVRVNYETGEETYCSRPYNAYISCFRVHGTNTLLLPRNNDERISVLNMENMIFAPSLPVDLKTKSVCATDDGMYIAAITRTATPGRAMVFHYAE